MIIDLRPCKVNISLSEKNVKTNLNFSSILSFSVISDNIFICASLSAYIRSFGV